MKRDIDFVRSILVRTELAEGPFDASELLTDAHSDMRDVLYHVELMQAHRLLDARIHRDMNGNPIHGEIIALTWDGCDYLDAIRDDRVWTKAKKAVKEAVGSTTIGLFKETALMVGKQLIASKLGV